MTGSRSQTAPTLPTGRCERCGPSTTTPDAWRATLPADNPTSGVDWNIQRRRDTAMGIEDLPRWFREAGRLRHPIRREFHLFTLLSGSRPGALMQARVEDLDL